MLTIEEIKQAVEFADGFELVSDSKGSLRLAFFDGGLIGDSVRIDCLKSKIWIYDLFLDRTIQGINKPLNIVISNMGNYLQAREIESIAPSKLFPHNGTTEGIREAREKAIRFVLEEMK